MNNNIDIQMVQWESPASIYKFLNLSADHILPSTGERNNLDIIIDFHWFFLHSRDRKESGNYNKPIGKFIYNTESNDDLIEKVLSLLHPVACGLLPVVKFTNMANVFAEEKLIVIYCFPHGISSVMMGELLCRKVGSKINWSK